MKKLYLGHYSDGFNVEQIGCLDLSVACASGYYDNENYYYYYCFLYAMLKQIVSEKVFVMEDIAAILGINIIDVENLEKEEVIEQIIHAIDNEMPVLVGLSYSSIFYDRMYKENNTSHYMIISGYDKDKQLLVLHDSLINREIVKVLLKNKVDVFTDFTITYDMFLEMWEKTKLLGINRFIKLSDEGKSVVSSYRELINYYLNEEKVNIEKYDFFL